MKCYLLFLFFCSLSVNIRAEDETVSVDKSVWDNIYNAAIVVCACTPKPIPTDPPQVCQSPELFKNASVIVVSEVINLCENINAANIKLTGSPETTATVKPETNATVKPETTATVKPETTATVKPETNATVKPETNATVKPETNATVKPETTATVKPETTATVKPETNATVKPETNATVKPETNATVKPETTATVKPETNATVKPETNATVKPETNARGTPGSNRTPGSNSGHDAAAGHQVANKPEPTKVAIHVVVIGVFCAFAAGVLVAIGCKYAYDRYRKRSYVLPPEQGMQM